MAETSTIFGFMKYVSATDILSDFKKTVDSHFVNSLKIVQTSTIFRLLTKAYTLFRKDIGFLLYIGNFRNKIVFFCIF